MDDSRIAEYDDMFDSCHHVVKVDDHTAIRRMCCKAIWPTAPRDFLVCTTWTKLEDGSIMVCSRSAPDDISPTQKGYVRGFLNIRFVLSFCIVVMFEIFPSFVSRSLSKYVNPINTFLTIPFLVFIFLFLRISGYYIQPYDTLSTAEQTTTDCPVDGCKVTLTAHTELGGNLPSSVINMLSTAAPMKMLSAIGELVASSSSSLSRSRASSRMS